MCWWWLGSLPRDIFTFLILPFFIIFFVFLSVFGFCSRCGSGSLTESLWVWFADVTNITIRGSYQRHRFELKLILIVFSFLEWLRELYMLILFCKGLDILLPLITTLTGLRALFGGSILCSRFTFLFLDIRWWRPTLNFLFNWVFFSFIYYHNVILKLIFHLSAHNSSS